MVQSIFYKEWLKLRIFWCLAFLVHIGMVIYLLLGIRSTLITAGVVETWATMIGRDVLMITPLMYLPPLTGIVLALCQWLPEMQLKRIRLTLHLPVDYTLSIGTMLLSSIIGLCLIYATDAAVLAAVGRVWLPCELVWRTFVTCLPWYIGGLIAYTVTTWCILEPLWRVRVVNLLIGAPLVAVCFLTSQPACYTRMMPWLLCLLAVTLVLPLSAICRLNGVSRFRYLVVALALPVAAWLLPALYELVAPPTDNTPFVTYSCLDSTFICFDHSGKQMRYVDFRGREFTKAEADSLMPLFSFRQLMAEGRLPDSLYGVALTPKLIQQNSVFFKTSPKQLNKPETGLYTMLESESGRVDLQLPPDVFRLTPDGLEFIDCETNIVNRAKSRSFTRELTKHGFTFPVRLIWGNPSTRKDYDNGFLLTDARHRLFQLKMVRGMPWVREIATTRVLGDSARFIQLFTVEPANRKLIGMVVTDDHRLFAVRSNGTLAQMDIDRYDPQSMQISIIGDLFHWTVTLYTATESRYYAVDADSFSRVAEAVVPDPELPLSRRIERWLLPVRLRFTSWQTQLVYPSVNND